jgi:AraC-like DNA-binding protein
MSRYISSNELWDIICKKMNFPNSPKGKNGIQLNEEFGSVCINHYNTGFGIKYTSFRAKFYDDSILENLNSYDSSFICFNTGKDLYMEDTLKNKEVKMDTNVCWNGEIHKGHLSNGIYCKNQQNIMHYITFDRDKFKTLTQNNEKFKSAQSIYKGDYIDVNFNNHINSKQQILLNDLLNIYTLEDNLQMLYLESKLLDLIYTSFNAIEVPNQKETIYLSEQDIESLYKAKDILTNNMNTPPSLKELSYKSAINEFKLKKGFKQLFGNTVYGFLQEHRLNEAKKLLEDNEINIGEASFLVGYKSISHFSKIFKDRFGITPIEIKKQSRTIYC